MEYKDTKVVYIEKDKAVRDILAKAKGEVCKEFEKVCLSEMSFKRMMKEMHDIFDGIERDLKPHLKG